MSVIRIVRVEETPWETLSVVLLDETIVGFGLELPDHGNQKDVSCIPPGAYPYKKYHSPRLQQKVFALQDVPGRSGIQIHVGNTRHDITGCVVVGADVGYLKGDRAVLNSALTMTKIMQKAGETGKVIITELFEGAT